MIETGAQLERECGACCGLGRISATEDRSWWDTCHVCGGAGVIPTEFGDEILKFVKKYLQFR